MASETRPRIAIFVIAYNAVRHLIRTIERIPPDLYARVEEIFVIDDASSDNTYYAALGYKYHHRIDKLRVFRNEVNQRYGGNQKVGYRYAIERGFDVVALLHGDGQYAPEVLPDLLAPFDEGADVVFGSRMIQPWRALRGGMPRYKYFGNRILTNIQRKLSGLELSEFHSGYRLYSTRALRQIPFTSFTNEWHFDSQILLAAHERDMKIVERPIPTYYGDEICHVNGIPYAVNCVMTTARYWWLRRQGRLAYPGAADVPDPGEVAPTPGKNTTPPGTGAAVAAPSSPVVTTARAEVDAG